MVAVAAASAVRTEDATANSLLLMEPDFAEVGKEAPTSVASRTVAAVKP